MPSIPLPEACGLRDTSQGVRPARAGALAASELASARGLRSLQAAEIPFSTRSILRRRAVWRVSKPGATTKTHQHRGRLREDTGIGTRNTLSCIQAARRT